MWRVYKDNDNEIKAIRFCKIQYSDGSITVDVAKNGNWNKGSDEYTLEEFEEKYKNVIKEFSYKTRCDEFMRDLKDNKGE